MDVSPVCTAQQPEYDSEKLTNEMIEKLGISKEEYADRRKNEGNELFKKGHFDEAIKCYDVAIECCPSAVLYSNRSMANLKCELFGLAHSDAEEAIKLDPTFIKAYYRRASAYMALGKYKKALVDYQQVAKIRPNDPDAKKKLEECRKIVKRKAFEKAIDSTEHKKRAIDEVQQHLEQIKVEDDYTGLHLPEEGVTVEFMKELVEFFKKQGRLHKKYAIQIMATAYDLLKDLPTLVDIKIADDQKFTICGDVHGQFYDLCNIFDLNGLPSEENAYLFNGDFVDRGSFSVETILTLLGFKILYPDFLYLARGNHESDLLNEMYGFSGEVKKKYNPYISSLFSELFCLLPLCHLINEKIFVTHGGISPVEGVTLEDIRKIDRIRQPPDDGLMCHLLWSDPQPTPGLHPSKRGVGCQFGPDITERFCANNGLAYVVRSHEVKPNGYEQSHPKLYTVFSAPNYCDQMGNLGAYINITGKTITKPDFKTFEAVPHPNVPPMYYANSMFGL